MKRRGFFGALAAAVGMGAVKATAEKPHCFAWDIGPLTDHPVYAKMPGWRFKRHRAFCNGREIHFVRRMVTGPEGWADVLVKGTDGRFLRDESGYDLLEERVHGNIQYACEERA